MFGRGKKPLALPAPPLSDRGRWKQGGVQFLIHWQDSGPKPAAQERVGNTLDTDTFQHKAISIVIVTAPMHQLSDGAELLIGHVRYHRA